MPPLSTTAVLRIYSMVAIQCLGSLQYGYHLAELNAPEAYMTCRLLDNPPSTNSTLASNSFLSSNNTHHHPRQVDCIPMTASQLGSVTGLISIGGLVTALFMGNVASRIGRQKASILSCVPFVLGSLVSGSSTSVWQLQLGRFVEGLGAGAAIVVVALYLSEVGPQSMRGQLGFMNQASINLGILVAQILGIFFSDYGKWRIILFFGAFLGTFYGVLLTCFLQETPKWYVSVGEYGLAKRALKYLRATSHVEEEFRELGGKDGGGHGNTDEERSNEPAENEALLDGTNRHHKHKNDIVSVKSFLFSKPHRTEMVTVCGILIAQQFCGINSIIFYGVSILSNLFPNQTNLINCMISVMNLVVTLYSSTIVDKFGRKVMLLVSITGMAIFAFGLGFGINNSLPILSASSATLYVFFFALGLGPIPFMIISELVPHNAVGAAQSVGTTANWGATFLVGYLFPVLNSKYGGNTYYLFVAFCVASIVFVMYFVPGNRRGGEEGERERSE